MNKKRDFFNEKFENDYIQSLFQILPGLLTAFLVACLASFCHLVTCLGAATIAILLGIFWEIPLFAVPI